MSSNDTVLVTEEQNKLYVYISATSTYANAETKCSGMQPVPGATTTGHLAVWNTYSEQVGARAVAAPAWGGCHGQHCSSNRSL